MAARSDSAAKRASREATDWLILLQNDPDDPDLLRRFDAWLAESPMHAAAWEATRHTSGIIGKVPPAYAGQWEPFVAASRTGDAWAPAAETRFGHPARRDRTRRLGLGLGAMIAAAVAVFALPSVMLNLAADHTTGTAQMRTVSLDDGSAVVLAPDSAIAVHYSAAERHVELLAGEAFFDVTHNADWPFRATADGVETVDLGTGFTVRRGKDEVAVAVEHGRVRVDYAKASPSISETLDAGQSVRVGRQGGVARGEVPPSQVGAWRQNQLIAQDEPVREVVDRLRPYFAGRIILTKGSFAGRPVTGVYNLADPVEAIRGIARTHGATVRRITPWVLVVSGD